MSKLHLIGGPMVIEPLEGGAIGLAHGTSITHAAYALPADSVRELWELLDQTLAEDAPTGVLGQVSALDDRGRQCALHVVRWGPAAVSLRERPERHAGWDIRLRDQVTELRDQLAG